MNLKATSHPHADSREVDPSKTVRAVAINQMFALPSIFGSEIKKERSLERTGRLESEVSDEILLEQVKTGSHAALALLFRRYARMVRSVALRILRDQAEAEDLVQEVFLFVFQRILLFDPARGSGRSWIVQVTYHRAIDRRRHLASRRFYANKQLDEAVLAADEPISESSFYERSIEGALGTEMVEKIEAELSSDQRRTLQLHFFEGHTFEEIAALTGHAVGNVRNHYYRGLEKMRRLIFRK